MKAIIGIKSRMLKALGLKKKIVPMQIQIGALLSIDLCLLTNSEKIAMLNTFKKLLTSTIDALERGKRKEDDLKRVINNLNVDLIRAKAGKKVR